MREYILDPLARLFRRPSFVACVALLAICAFAVNYGARLLGVTFTKQAIPLQRSLDELDLQKMRWEGEPGYELIEARRISQEIEAELGTQDYIQWFVNDLSYPEGDPRRTYIIFVTYYTGNPDKVPHVPDWCYVGSGGRVDSTRNIQINVPNNGTDSDVMPLRVLEISIPTPVVGRYYHRTVGYFFSVQGEYAATRDQVRLRQAWPFDRYAYFSKVELNLANEGDLPREEIIAALERLAQRLVPVLVEDHWPDWQAVNAAPR